MPILDERYCLRCDSPFQPVQKSQRFCCTEHRIEYHKIVRPPRRLREGELVIQKSVLEGVVDQLSGWLYTEDLKGVLHGGERRPAD